MENKRKYYLVDKASSILDRIKRLSVGENITISLNPNKDEAIFKTNEVLIAKELKYQSKTFDELFDGFVISELSFDEAKSVLISWIGLDTEEEKEL